jgi:diazepam-binding inhibitor (GABA receptor modulating acyl-CoA-binding protein)
MDKQKIQKSFDHYSEKVKTLKNKPKDDELLKLYGLYKQAKFGDNNTSKPWAFQFELSAKWNAWMLNKGKSKEDSMNQYINFVKFLFSKE